MVKGHARLATSMGRFSEALTDLAYEHCEMVLEYVDQGLLGPVTNPRLREEMQRLLDGFADRPR